MNIVLFITSIVVTLLVFGYSVLLGKQRRLFRIRALSILILFSVLLGINLLPIQLTNKAQLTGNQDILFVVDTTLSMNANDGRNGNDQTRLENAKEDITAIAKENIGASIAIMTFTDVPMLYLPLTPNTADITTAIETLYTPSYLNNPPSIARYTDIFKEVTTYMEAQKKNDPTRQRTVIFVSDFEIFNKSETNEEVLAAAAPLKTHAGGFAAITYGSSEGSKILKTLFDYETGTFQPAYIVNPSSSAGSSGTDFDFSKFLDSGPEGNYKAAISKANYELSGKLATSLGGQSLTYKEPGTYNAALQKAFSSAVTTAQKDPKTQALKQNWLYAPFAAVLFVLVVVQEVIKPTYIEKLATKRRKKA